MNGHRGANNSSSTGVPGGGGGEMIRYPANCNASDPEASAMDKLYEPKENKKFFRIVTVIAYIFCVSMVAILLSLYYLFLWNPYIKQHKQEMAKLQEQERLGLLPTTMATTEAPYLPRPLALKSRMMDALTDIPIKLAWPQASDEPPFTTVDADGKKHLEDPFTTYAKAKRAKERFQKIFVVDVGSEENG